MQRTELVALYRDRARQLRADKLALQQTDFRSGYWHADLDWIDNTADCFQRMEDAAIELERVATDVEQGGFTPQLAGAATVIGAKPHLRLVDSPASCPEPISNARSGAVSSR